MSTTNLAPGATAKVTAPVTSAVAVAVAALAVVPAVSPGTVAWTMLAHIAIMNVVAPLVASVLAAMAFAPRLGTGALAAATLAQLVVLWAWHAPPVVASSLAVHLVLHILLLAASLVFWLAVLSALRAGRWAPIGALLVTGKLACLIGALMVFANRPLYASSELCLSLHTSLEDQRLAGLLMLTACPLSYLVAAAIVAAQLIPDQEDRAHGPAR